MAYRGRGGRGRYGGRGGGRSNHAKQESFVEFPEIELPDRKSTKEEKEEKEERVLAYWNFKLVKFYNSSPYFLEENIAKKNQSVDIERFSDWGKKKTAAKRDALSNFLLLEPRNFPKELIKGAKWEQPNPKKVRWNPDSELQKWDLFEKLDEKFQGGDEKGEKEKKEGEDEEEEEEGGEEGEEELSDDDYNQNVDFDDDDDDYNDMDDGNDEPEY